MRLRNKKTGEIIRFYDGITLNGEDYDSLAELNDEWEDCDELKAYWYIDTFLYEIRTIGIGVNERLDDFNKEIGNYFETEEEAEKAVEKLKAWKRLKDAGCKFVLDDNLAVRFVTPNATKIETAEQQKSLSDDFKLLFGGKEW